MYLLWLMGACVSNLIHYACCQGQSGFNQSRKVVWRYSVTQRQRQRTADGVVKNALLISAIWTGWSYNCHSPCKPFSPRSPLTPLKPSRPGNPSSPGGPVIVSPGNPFSPTAPVGPTIPGIPCGPGGPGDPVIVGQIFQFLNIFTFTGKNEIRRG